MQKYYLRNRQFGRLMACLLVLVVLVTACESGFEGGPLPTLGPITNVSGGSIDRVSMVLTASTNCVEVGEVVTFTLQVQNTSTFPLTLTGSPVLDIVITPLRKIEPVQRWSASNQYPVLINPVFVPGEDRTYTWQWVADSVYAEDALQDNGVHVGASTISLNSFDTVRAGGGLDLSVGVKTRDLAQGSVPCAQMPRP